MIKTMPKAWTPVTRLPLVIPGTNIVIGRKITARKPRIATNDTGSGEYDTNDKLIAGNFFGASGSSIGFVIGLFYANQKGSGFWGYMGYSFLFSLIGGVAGTAVNLTMKKIST